MKLPWQRDRITGVRGISVRQSLQQGQGIFATRSFRAGEIIETAPLLTIASEQKQALAATSLYSYYFLPDPGNGVIAVGLGFSSLYKHSHLPNATCGIHTKSRQLILRALRSVAPGEAISINYNGSPEDATPVAMPPKASVKEELSYCLDNSHLYVANTRKKGRGVFTSRYITKGDVIEVCPFITLSAIDGAHPSYTGLLDYTFELGDPEGALALVLGFGSLYNHARQSNAAYYADAVNNTMSFWAEEDIPRGREICINYAGRSGADGAAWFASRDIVCQPL